MRESFEKMIAQDTTGDNGSLASIKVDESEIMADNSSFP